MATLMQSKQVRNITTILLSIFFIISSNSIFALDITVASLDVSTIQTAVDQVESDGGGTVFLPAGTANHGGNRIRMAVGVSLIGQGSDQTIIDNAYISVAGDFFGDLDQPFRISNMYLRGDSGIEIRKAENFRIDHIHLEAVGGVGITVRDSYSGVVDNSYIDATNYGVMITNMSDSFDEDWVLDTTQLLGSMNAIFIEDSVFVNYHHAVVGHANAHYVARYNDMRGGGGSPGHAVDAHGEGYTDSDTGTRLVECYGNTISAENNPGSLDWKAIAIRGGAAVIFDNHYVDWRNGVVLTLESGAPNHHPETYPDDIWIWNNTNNGNSDFEEFVFITSNMNGHSPLLSEDLIVEGEEFFLREPSEAQDGFTYTPYAYPHPFQSELTNPDIVVVTPGEGDGGDGDGDGGDDGGDPDTTFVKPSGLRIVE